MLARMGITGRGRGGRDGAVAGTAGRRGVGTLGSFTPGQTLIIVLLLLFLVLTLAMPLRTYAEQRAELARVEENIARMEERSIALQAERDRYSDPEYIREQARIRLGLVEEGETPFRIIDPAIGGSGLDAPGEREAVPSAPWYRQLWASISEPPPAPEPVNPAREEATRPDRLPVVPEPAPEPAPEDAPPAE